MVKNSSIFNFKKIPAALIFGLLLLLAVQILCIKSETFWRTCYLYGDPIKDDALRLRARLTTMPENNGLKNVFLIGSSQVREDFDTKYLNDVFEDSGWRFYNLGLSGGGHPMEIFMLKGKFLEKKPDMIVYMPFVGSFYYHYDFRKMKYLFDTSILPHVTEHLGIKDFYKHRDDYFSTVLGKLSFFYQYRKSLKNVFDTIVRDRLSRERRKEPQLFGYTENKPRAFFLDMVEKSEGKRFRIGPHTKLNEELFVVTAKDIISKGIEFIVMSGPTHPLMKACYDSEKIDGRYHAFLKKQARKTGFTYIREDKLPVFNDDEFVDFTHLNEKGRKKFNQFFEKHFEKIAADQRFLK